MNYIEIREDYDEKEEAALNGKLDEIIIFKYLLLL